MDLSAFIDLVQAIIGGALLTLALVMMLGSAIGALRFPDLYTRLHAASVGDGVAAPVFALGLAIMAPDLAAGIKLMLLAALLAALGPVLTHLTGAAAHSGGLTPIAGAYLAPRPGQSREAQ